MTDDLAPQRERKFSEEVTELKTERARLKRLVDGRTKAAKQALPPPPWKPSWMVEAQLARSVEECVLLLLTEGSAQGAGTEA